MRSDAIGFIRHAAMMLARGATQIKEEWDDGEVILSPQQTAELNLLLRDLRKYTSRVSEVARKFDRVTESRKVEMAV